MLVLKSFGSEKHFGLTFFWVQTFLCVNIFMSEKMLGSEKKLGLKKYWVWKFIDPKKFGSGKILCLKNDHSVKNKCRLRKVGKSQTVSF